MRTANLIRFIGLGFLVAAAGCSVTLPSGAGLFGAIDEAFRDAEAAIADAVADPLGAKPFPVLIGGDASRLYYATSLTDIRINFRGPVNDVVIPGFAGPSNLYKYENNKRQLILPLIPGGAFAGLSTDGRFLAYVSTPVLDLTAATLSVLDVSQLSHRVLFESDAENILGLPLRVAVDAGRAAFPYYAMDRGVTVLRVVDLTRADPNLEFEIPGSFGSLFGMRGNRLAYLTAQDEPTASLILHDLATGDEVLIATGIRTPYNEYARLVLTDNAVVWSEPSSATSSRVIRYDVPTGLTRVWADGVVGQLTGATDTAFVTEEYVDRWPRRPNQIVIRRYQEDGRSKKLATFRANGLAGQSQVIGNHAAWVNNDREIVLAPLTGGNRTIFRPF
jgi:hypothetical protein